MTITLYDIPSQKQGAWSPNTFKARCVATKPYAELTIDRLHPRRIALNYKGIPFQSKWLEYPDIEKTLKELGGAPTSKKPGTAQDHYTLPAIHDSETGKTITESMNIAVYLDEHFPDKPLLFPFGTHAAIALYNHHFTTVIQPSFGPLYLPPTCWNLNPVSSAYFRKTREEWYKVKMEEMSPAGPKREELLAKTKEAFSTLAKIYATNGLGADGKEKKFFLGDTFSYADAIIAGFLAWPKVLLGEDSEEWKEIASWDGGRWAEIVELTKTYQAA